MQTSKAQGALAKPNLTGVPNVGCGACGTFPLYAVRANGVKFAGKAAGCFEVIETRFEACNGTDVGEIHLCWDQVS